MDTDYQRCLQHFQSIGKNRLAKVATTCTEKRHKKTTKIGYNMYRGWTQTDCQMWLQHLQRMDTNRLLKVATTCTEGIHKNYYNWLQHLQRMDTN